MENNNSDIENKIFISIKEKARTLSPEEIEKILTDELKASGYENWSIDYAVERIKKMIAKENNPNESKKIIGVNTSMESKNQEKSNFKWFDTKHIKHINKLSKEDIKWLNAPSVSAFTPFSFIARGQFDLLLVFILYVALLPFPKFEIVTYFILIVLIIFSIKHLRRLVWNRGFYKTIEEYKKSEKKWNNWGIFFLIMNIFYLIGQFSK